MGLDFLREKRAAEEQCADRWAEVVRRELEARAAESQGLIADELVKVNGALPSTLDNARDEPLPKYELHVTVVLGSPEAGRAPAVKPVPMPMPETFVRLDRWLGYVPSPGLRKQVGKMLGDQQAYVEQLRSEGRNGAARWQEVCTHLLWLLYVVKSGLKLGRDLRGRVRS